MAHAWVIGAGYVGGGVAEALARAGFTVDAVRRRAPGASTPGVRWVSGDVREEATFAALGPAPALVVYAIAGARPAEGERDAYLEGIQSTVAALEAKGTARTRLVFVSSTGVYSEAGGGWVDEDTLAVGAGERGARLLEAERRARAWSGPTLVARLSGIYGPGRTSLVRQLEDGTARMPGQLRWTNRIHQADAVRALVFAAGLPTLPESLVLSDAEPAPLDQVLRWLAARIGVPVPDVEAAPGGAVRAYRAEGNKRASSARLQGLGFAFTYPTFREGYGALLGPAQSAAARPAHATTEGE